MNGQNGSAHAKRVVLMVWDGLRPDCITAAITPHLHRLAAEGVRFTNSHAVYPTVTRVNSPSIATGMLPAGHGIPNNAFLSWERGVINTGDHTHLEGLRAGRGGRMVHTPTVGEHIARAGGRAVVVSTGSPGSTTLQHPEAARTGGRLLNPALIGAAERERLEARLGPLPARTMPNTAQNAWFTRLITEDLLAEETPDLLVFWHCDPDHTQHEHGIGHPLTLASLRDADTNLGSILAALDRLGLARDTAVIVTSDHGFSTITGRADAATALREAGLRDGDDLRVVGDMVYVPEHDPERIAGVVEVLHRTTGIGPLFTGGDGRPVFPGTFDLAEIGAGGTFAPDILFGLAWDDRENEHGYAGTSWSPWPLSAKAGSHGNLSPWDITNSLVAGGAGFKRGLVSDVPAGNVDIAPTVLRLLGLSVPGEMHGRVLAEALRGGQDPAAMPVERLILEEEHNGIRQTLRFSRLGSCRYLDFGKVER